MIEAKQMLMLGRKGEAEWEMIKQKIESLAKPPTWKHNEVKMLPSYKIQSYHNLVDV